MKTDTRTTTLMNNVLFMYIRMFFVLFVSLFTTRIVINQLGADDFGLYNVIASVVIFFSILQGALNTATSRYIVFELGKGQGDNLNRIYSMAINCHILMAIAFFLIIEMVGLWFVGNKIEMAPEQHDAAMIVLQCSLVTMCTQIVSSPLSANIVAHEKMNYYAIVGIVEAVLQLGVAVVLSYTSYDKLIVYGNLVMCVALIVFLLNIIYCTTNFKDTKYIRFWDSKIAKQFFSYSGFSVLVSGADVVSTQGLNVFFNWFVGLRGNAALGIANKVNSGFEAFVQNLSTSYRPQIIKSYAEGKLSYFMKLIFSTSKISYLFLFLVSIPIVCNLEFVLDLWIGKGHYPKETSFYVVIILLYQAFDSFQRPFWQAVHATGNLKTHQIMIGTIKLSALPLTYLSFILGGSGTTTLFVWSLLNGVAALARTLYMRKLINLNLKSYVKEVVLRMIGITIIVIPFVYIFRRYMEAGWLRFVISVPVLVSVIAIIGYLFYLNNSEKELLKNNPLCVKIKKIIKFK